MDQEAKAGFLDRVLLCRVIDGFAEISALRCCKSVYGQLRLRATRAGATDVVGKLGSMGKGAGRFVLPGNGPPPDAVREGASLALQVDSIAAGERHDRGR